MRERARKNKSAALEDGRPARQEWSVRDGRGRPFLQSPYTGETRKLRSTATAEWVNAPTEMKSTPVSA